MNSDANIQDMENSNDHQISNMGESTTPATKESCCEAAVQVLGSLLAENDEVIEIWYLMGCAFQALENKKQKNNILNVPWIC